MEAEAIEAEKVSRTEVRSRITQAVRELGMKHFPKRYQELIRMLIPTLPGSTHRGYTYYDVQVADSWIKRIVALKGQFDEPIEVVFGLLIDEIKDPIKIKDQPTVYRIENVLFKIDSWSMLSEDFRRQIARHDSIGHFERYYSEPPTDEVQGKDAIRFSEPLTTDN